MVSKAKSEYLKVYYKEHKGKEARGWSYTDQQCHKKLKDMTSDERREYFRLAKQRQYKRQKRAKKAQEV